MQAPAAAQAGTKKKTIRGKVKFKVEDQQQCSVALELCRKDDGDDGHVLVRLGWLNYLRDNGTQSPRRKSPKTRWKSQGANAPGTRVCPQLEREYNYGTDCSFCTSRCWM